MDFNEALKELKAGKKVSRRGWDDKGRFISTDATDVTIHPHVDMWTAQKTVPCVLLANQDDMFAEDWEVVE